MRVIRFLLKGLAVLVGLAVLGLIGFYVYLSTRPTPKTIKAAGIITVPAASSFPLKFIDYMFVNGSKLYAGYTSQGVVAVIDTATNQVVAEIGDLPRSHGIAVAGDRGFATASGDDTVGVFEVSTNKLLKKIPGGVGPDAIIYDDKLRLIYAADHAGKTGTLIDPVMMSVVGTVQLGGVAEYAQADPQSGLIYQNDEDTNELVVVDPQKQMVTQRYKLGEGTGPSGLAYDPGNRRLFVTCDNNKLIVLNADTGQVVATLPIGSGVDGASYDPELRRVYTFNGFGTMTVIQQDSADSYRVLEQATTHFGGHAGAVDPATHRIYVAYFGSIAAYDPVTNP
jgi:DNA-binding beta-propeller fold protein YncE